MFKPQRSTLLQDKSRGPTYKGGAWANFANSSISNRNNNDNKSVYIKGTAYSSKIPSSSHHKTMALAVVGSILPLCFAVT